MMTISRKNYPLLPLDNCMQTPRKRKSELLNKAISQIDPAEKARVTQLMALSVRISEALEKKGWSKSQFASLMRKEPSEVTKWLSGTHNFTANTLTDIGLVLGINFFQEERPEVVQDQYSMVIMLASHSEPSSPFRMDPYSNPVNRLVSIEYLN